MITDWIFKAIPISKQMFCYHDYKHWTANLGFTNYWKCSKCGRITSDPPKKLINRKARNK